MPPIPTTEKRPFIPFPGGVQVEMIYTYLGQRCENVFHVLQGDGATEATSAQMTAIINAFNTWWNSQGRLNCSNQLQLVLVRARQMGVQNGLVLEKTPTGTVVGGDGGAPLPGNVTVAVKHVTGFGGRSYRGRTFVPGLTQTDIVGDQIVAGYQAGLLSTFRALRDAVSALSGCTMQVVSYAHNKFWRATAVGTQILDFSVDLNLDSQRRRLAGRGQ